MPSIDGGVSEFLQNIYEFSVNLLKKTHFEEPEECDIILPTINIHSTLCLLYWGSRHQCAAEMAQVLCLNNSTGDPRIISNNYKHLNNLMKEMNNDNSGTNGDINLKHIAKIFMSQPFQYYDSEFMRTAIEKFHVEPKYIDLFYLDDAVKEINNSIYTSTDSECSDIVDLDIVHHELEIITAIATIFKCSINFHEHLISLEKDKFHVNPIKCVNIDYCTIAGEFKYALLNEHRTEILEIPIGNGNDLSIQILLPLYRFGLENILNIDSKRFHRLSSEMRIKSMKVKIPASLSTCYKTCLEKILDKMGMRSIFSEYADLAYLMDLPENLKISLIPHKTIFKMNVINSLSQNSPSTSAASTVSSSSFNSENVNISPNTSSAPREKEEDMQEIFCINRPFLLIVKWNKFNIPLYMGAIHNPNSI